MKTGNAGDDCNNQGSNKPTILHGILKIEGHIFLGDLKD
jgi:hypothetical protein